MLIAALCFQAIWGLNGQFIADALVALSYLEPWFIATFNWDGGLFRHTWSLGLEEFFYLLWPLAFGLVGFQSRNKKVILFMIGLIALGIPVLFTAAGIGANPITSYLLRFGAILIGCFLSLGKFEINKNFKIALLTVSVVGLLVTMLQTLPGLGSFIAALSSGVMILSLSRQKVDWAVSKVIFENRFILWFGKISYELYLVHYVAIVLAIWWLAGLSKDESVIRLALVPVGIGSILVAYVVHIVQRWIRAFPFLVAAH